MKILIDVSDESIQAATRWLEHHGKKPTKKAIRALLKGSCDEGLLDLESQASAYDAYAAEEANA